MASKLAQSPEIDDKAADYVDNSPDTLPSVPLDAIEGPPKTRAAQLLAVLISGVALFSDGYNIQVTGAWSVVDYRTILTYSLHQHCPHGPVPGSDDDRDEDSIDQLSGKTSLSMSTERNPLIPAACGRHLWYAFLWNSSRQDRQEMGYHRMYSTLGRRSHSGYRCPWAYSGRHALDDGRKCPDARVWLLADGQIGRGVAGVGAGGEYAVCTTSSIEAAEEAPS